MLFNIKMDNQQHWLKPTNFWADCKEEKEKDTDVKDMDQDYNKISHPHEEMQGNIKHDKDTEKKDEKK
jgi:hypothetical protein